MTLLEQLFIIPNDVIDAIDKYGNWFDISDYITATDITFSDFAWEYDELSKVKSDYLDAADILQRELVEKYDSTFTLDDAWFDHVREVADDYDNYYRNPERYLGAVRRGD